MERPLNRFVMGSLVFLSLMLTAYNASADDEQFPESRFGVAPPPVKMGLDSGFAGREVDSWGSPPTSQPAPDSALGGRKPAGLEFEGEAPQPRKPMAVEQAQPNPPTAAPVQVRDDNGMDDSHPSASAVLSNSMDAGEIRRKGVQEVAIIASDLGFFPKTFFVSRDVPVRLYVTGSSKNTLCIMMDSFQVRKQLKSQRIEEITFTPNMPGKYRFYCPVNGMEGEMIVKELSSSLASQ